MATALDSRARAPSACAGIVEVTPEAEQRESVTSTTDLEEARDDLLARLHARSDDFAATRQLQTVRHELLLAWNATTDHDEPMRLRHIGLSFFDRMRAKRHCRNSRRERSG